VVVYPTNPIQKSATDTLVNISEKIRLIFVSSSFAVLKYPIRCPESQLAGEVLEEHSHAAGDVSDESDAEDGDWYDCQEFRDDPFHLRFLLFVACEPSSLVS